MIDPSPSPISPLVRPEQHTVGTTYYRKLRAPLRSTTVTGQCKVCLDLFSVDLYAVGPEVYVSETPRLKYQPWNREKPLVHRTAHCHDGKVCLYGTLEGLLPPTQE